MYRSPISRELLRNLTQTRNTASLLRLGLHVGLLLCSGTLFMWALDQQPWLALPVLLMHGMFFTFLGYAGLGHELNHNNVFSKPAANKALLHIVSFLTWNNPVYFKASHSCHHKHTLQHGVDFEVNPAPYPLIEKWWRYAFIDLAALKRAFLIFFQNTKGVVKGQFGETAFPAGSTARKQLVNTARIYVALHITLTVLFVVSGHPELLLLLSFANFFCTLPNRLLAKLQHSGLQANSSDFRQSTRTVLLPQFWAFLYWNMNYHTEHHMYPSVPYCQLPLLRKAIEHDLPTCIPGIGPHMHTLRMVAPKHPNENAFTESAP